MIKNSLEIGLLSELKNKPKERENIKLNMESQKS